MSSSIQAVEKTVAGLTTRIGLLVASFAVAVVLTVALREWLPQTQFVFFFGLAVLATYLGGSRTGAAAVLLGIITFELLLPELAPAGESRLALLVRVATLAGVGLGTVWLVQAVVAARRRAEAAAAAHGRLAEELEEQAGELELQVSESEAMAAELEDLNHQLEEQTDHARRAARRAERLHALTTRLLAMPAGEPVLHAVAREARLATEARAATVVMPGSDGRLVGMAFDGAPDRIVGAADDLLADDSPAHRVMATGEPLWLESRAELASRFPAMAAAAGTESNAWAALPMQGSHQRLGVITLGFDLPGEFRPEDRSFMLLLAQQCAYAVERAQLNAAGMRARVRAEFAERRLAFLAEASQRLAASLDYQTTLASLARMAVPDLADWCFVHLADEAGRPRLVAAAHADDATLDARRQLEERYAGSGLEAEAFRRVAALHRPDFLVAIDEAELAAAAADADHLAALRELGIHTQLSVPITAEQGVCGSLTLSLTDPGREFGEPDITLAAELGRRAGQAVENAKLYAAAHQASAAKSDFLAVMSHELRTPLNAILGYSDLILLGVPEGVPPPARRQVERIRSAADSLLHLVEEVLSFSRIEAGKEEIRISPLDLSAVLHDAVAMIEPLAAGKNLALRVVVPSDLRLVSDERKIRQIVTNLLSNAVKFTEQGSVEVRVDVEDGWVRVEVADTGIGIPAEHMERIFDPFWQVEQPSTRRFGGTGLGLGVARKLARLLEGRLEVRSEEGRGSTFSLLLPRHTPGMPRSGARAAAG